MVRFVVGPIHENTPLDTKVLESQYFSYFQGSEAEEQLIFLRNKKIRLTSGNLQEYGILKVSSEDEVNEIKMRGILYSDLYCGKQELERLKKRKAPSSAQKKGGPAKSSGATSDSSSVQSSTDDDRKQEKIKDESWFRQTCHKTLAKQKKHQKKQQALKQEAETARLEGVMGAAASSAPHNSEVPPVITLLEVPEEISMQEEIPRCVLVANSRGWLWMDLSKGTQGRYEHDKIPYRCFKLPPSIDRKMDSLCHFYAGWLSLQTFMLKFLSGVTNAILANGGRSQKDLVHNIDLLVHLDNETYPTHYHSKLKSYDLKDPRQAELYKILSQIYFRLCFNQHPMVNIKWTTHPKNEFYFHIGQVAMQHLRYVQQMQGASPRTALPIEDLLHKPPIRLRLINPYNPSFILSSLLISCSVLEQRVSPDRQLDLATQKWVRKDETRLAFQVLDLIRNQVVYRLSSDFQFYPELFALQCLYGLLEQHRFRFDPEGCRVAIKSCFRWEAEIATLNEGIFDKMFILHKKQFASKAKQIGLARLFSFSGVKITLV